MPGSVKAQARLGHLAKLETVDLRMAKGHLPAGENERIWRGKLGKAVERCFVLAGKEPKEAAGIMGRDRSQVGKWIAGTERPQIDLLMAHGFGRVFLIALAEQLEDTEIDMQIRFRGER